jgi:isopentenyl diphosphate isomerase/L-lactate dehydrogenase-like FMN-dependent dehydrogenase
VKTLKGTDCEVYVDGAVSTGSDIFKALAIGAKMVFLGRAPIWGLACGGQKGVERVELDNTMALCGNKKTIY